jgi:HEAT repeat protein
MSSALKEEINVGVRQNIARALGQMGDKAIVPLREALKDDDPQVRLEAVKAVGLLSDAVAAEAIPELTQRAGAENHELRKAAVAVLARVVGPMSRDAWDPLLRCLQDPDLECKRNAALGLAAIGRFNGAEAAPAVALLI